ncbi:MAG: hypothetical protein Q8M94_04730, partial [Ignavibacteria bacterium]|nr:hypothetical protein [Ignavibacteria bacterium]
ENNGKPITEGKNPSIDYIYNNLIVVSQIDIGIGFDIKVQSFRAPYGQYVLVSEIYVTDGAYSLGDYSMNANPVVSVASGMYGKLLVTFKSDGYLGSGIFCKLGEFSNFDGTIYWYYNSIVQKVSSTDINSSNPTMCVRKDGVDAISHLGWQQGTTLIKYCTLTPLLGTNTISFSAVETPSTGDANNYKRSPSISVVGSNPTLVWIGSIYQGATTRVFRRSGSISRSTWGSFEIYGTNADSPTEYNSRVVWSENNVNKLYHPWKGFRTLNTVGKAIQLSTGTSMYAVAYRQFSPFDFTISQDIETLPKLNSFVNKCGRQGIVAKGEAEFYFVLGDVMFGSDVIGFVDIPDTTTLLNTNDLNVYMETNSFSLDGTSDFYF